MINKPNRELYFDPSREPLPPAEELWGAEGIPAADGIPDTMTDSPVDSTDDATLRALAAASFTDDVIAPRDAMWLAISARRAREAKARSHATVATDLATEVPFPPALQVETLTPRATRRIWPQLAALAATLVVGVAIGRTFDPRARDVFVAPATASNNVGAEASGEPRTDASAALPLMLAQLTAEHLGRTEALLVTAKQDLSVGGTAQNAMLADWARDLLSTTRLLLDTNELTEPRTRRLLQDLELTLALILQAQSSGRSADVQAARAELSTGDLLLRVRGAATATMPTMLSTDDVRGMSE